MPDYCAEAYEERDRYLAKLAARSALRDRQRQLAACGPWSVEQLATFHERAEGVRTRLEDLVKRKPRLIRAVRYWYESNMGRVA
jgi:hypothetical protein